MSIPDYQTVMLPLLRFAGDSKEHSIREAIEHVSNEFGLTESQRLELLPSGRQAVIDNRVGWARTYMKKAGLLESTRRSYFRITDSGRKVLKANPKRIDVKFLEQFPEFIEFRNVQKEKDSQDSNGDHVEDNRTPQELIESGYQSIHKHLAQEILSIVKQASPGFFEKLVVELLLKMGYGGSFKDAGRAIGRSGDGGIDGIVKEDKLGLDVIYIQAKRWESSVGSGELRNFVGSLVGHKANKGVFITTSGFSPSALEYVKTINHKVILIDGKELTDLMIENGVGVSNVITYSIKKIDSDFFIEE